MHLLIAALKAEMKEIIRRSNAVKIPGPVSGLYEFETKAYKWHLLISGAGPEKATRALESYLDSYLPEAIVNLGIAASLNKDEIYTVHEVSKVIDERSGFYFVSDGADLRWPVSLITCYQAVTDEEKSFALIQHFGENNLVDMEAFSICELSYRHGLPCRIFKAVSDHAGSSAEQQVRKNISRHARLLADTFYEKIVS